MYIIITQTEYQPIFVSDSLNNVRVGGEVQ